MSSPFSSKSGGHDPPAPMGRRPWMHRLATVHARDNQPTNQPTNDQRRHDTAYLNKRLFY